MQSGAGAVAVAGVGWGEAVGTSVVRGRSNGGDGNGGSTPVRPWGDGGLEQQGLGTVGA